MTRERRLELRGERCFRGDGPGRVMTSPTARVGVESVGCRRTEDVINCKCCLRRRPSARALTSSARVVSDRVKRHNATRRDATRRDDIRLYTDDGINSVRSPAPPIDCGAQFPTENRSRNSISGRRFVARNGSSAAASIDSGRRRAEQLQLATC